MSAITTFSFNSNDLRTLNLDGEPWFVAKDVCTVLEIGNSRQALSYLDEDEKGVTTADTLGGRQQLAVINEPGLYSLVLRSRKPEAKVFKRWVTHEVLPAIRRTGAYQSAPALPQTYADALRELASTVEAKEVAEARALELEGPAKAWDVMVSAETGDYAVDEAAKILSRDPDIEIGRNRLFTYMETLGWIYRHGHRNQWHAYQRHVDSGRLTEKMTAAFLNTRTGEMENPAPTIRVTAKGLESLHQRLTAISTENPDRSR